ncbi:MAG: hypothetical protein ABIW79_01870 [Gemmatimonas sp.]
MRTRHCSHLLSAVATLTALLHTVSLGAQESTRVLTGRASAGIYGQGSDPRGDFGNNTGAGWGGGGSVVLRLDPAAIANLRADLSFLTYGNSRRRIPLAGTGGLVKLDLRTSNNIASFVMGPQLLGPTGPIMPYVSALGGFSVFWTQSSVEGTSNDNEPFASTTNSSDAVLAYGGAAGLYIRVANGARPVRIELGARVLRHDNVNYLNDERVRDAFENNSDPVPVRGRADFVTYFAGVSVVIW